MKDGITDGEQLDTWDLVLAEEASRIEAARIFFISRIRDISAGTLSRIASLDGVLKLNLESALYSDGEKPDKEVYFRKIRENRTREIQQRSCLTGPHRDDIAISLNDTDTRAYASQGQARSIALVLKLAVIELIERDQGDAPVILLDDVESELDKGRSEALFELLLKSKRQIFVSGTDAGLAGKIIPESTLSYSSFEVLNGVINSKN